MHKIDHNKWLFLFLSLAKVRAALRLVGMGKGPAERLIHQIPVGMVILGQCSGFFGGDWAWIILLLLIGGNGWGMGGFGGGFPGF